MKTPSHACPRASLCAISLCFLLSHAAHADLVDGLTAYYNFDDNLIDQAHGLAGAASTVQDDLSFVDAQTGTYGAGLFGGGGYAAAGPNTGHAQTASSNDNNGFGDNITVQWWGQVANFDVGWQAGVAKGEGNNWRFHRQGGDLTMAWQGGGGDIGGGGAGPAINDGLWHHLVGTKDSVLGRVLYIDGVQVATGPAGTPMTVDNGLPMMVGENPQGNGRDWNGGIDDVAIWNRALDATEVSAIFAAGSGGTSLGTLLIPEPSTGLLSMLALGLFFVRRRKR